VFGRGLGRIAEDIQYDESGLFMSLGELSLDKGLMKKEVKPSGYVRSSKRDDWGFSQIVVLSEPLSRTAEAIRNARSRIQRQSLDLGIRSFAILGASSECGSSFIAANLAVSFAQTGQRTVLVDTNFATSGQTEFFGIPPNSRGLAEWLTCDDGGRDIGQYGLTPLPNLSLVPAGQCPDASEPLQHPRLVTVMTQLCRMFEVIIYDAPPATDLANAVAVAAIAERTILVGREQRTPIATLQQLQSLIENCHGKVEGVILARF
jgi:tyrosine-protein kinase Etk/Wzc